MYLFRILPVHGFITFLAAIVHCFGYSDNPFDILNALQWYISLDSSRYMTSGELNVESGLNMKIHLEDIDRSNTTLSFNFMSSECRFKEENRLELIFGNLSGETDIWARTKSMSGTRVVDVHATKWVGIEMNFVSGFMVVTDLENLTRSNLILSSNIKFSGKNADCLNVPVHFKVEKNMGSSSVSIVLPLTHLVNPFPVKTVIPDCPEESADPSLSDDNEKETSFLWLVSIASFAGFVLLIAVLVFVCFWACRSCNADLEEWGHREQEMSNNQRKNFYKSRRTTTSPQEEVEPVVVSVEACP